MFKTYLMINNVQTAKLQTIRISYAIGSLHINGICMTYWRGQSLSFFKYDRLEFTQIINLPQMFVLKICIIVILFLIDKKRIDASTIYTSNI